MMWLTLTFVVAMATLAVAMELPITKSFSSGFQSDFCRTMPRAVNGWTAHIIFTQPITRLDMYRAIVVEIPADGRDFVITNKDYNGKLNAGDNLCLKFTARTRSPVRSTVYFCMEGIDESAPGCASIQQPPATTPSNEGSSGDSVLWELSNMPEDSVGDPRGPFNTESTGRFDEGSLSVVSDPAGLPGKVLRVFYKEGSYVKIRDQRGAQFYSTPTAPRLSMKLAYDIFFSPGFDFVKGGKLPGLFGGSRNCSGGRHSDTCFSTRLMWRREGDGEVYAYFPAEQAPGLCDDPGNICNPTAGTSLGRGTWRFQVGQWQTISQRVTLNTPGELNGQLQVWFNGQQVLDIPNLNIRTRPDLLIEGLFFSTFFGGSDDSWAATADCSTYYKNFVISA